LIATETPFNSIGSDGARVDSEAFALLTVAVAGARLTLARATANSPAAKPAGLVAGLTEGEGLGLGDGDGLTDGLGVAVGLATGTLIRVAPVKSVTVPVDSVVAFGNNW